MKNDIDTLMKANELEAMLITGPAQYNPFMVYMTGEAHLTNADLLKKINADPILFCNPMERDEAAGTGLSTRNLGDYKYNELLKQANGNATQALAMRYKLMFSDMGISTGKVAICGKMDAGNSYAVFKALQELMPEILLVGDASNAVLLQAMATKDGNEVQRIRKMGGITTAVVGKVADYLTSHPVKQGVLVKNDGEPLTVGEVKRHINLWLAELGADNPEGCIFAIGRDAGVPHSSGNPSDQLRLGQTIVFDIFPCEAGGGYHYDFTRTWCLGYAPDEVQALYDHVFTVYKQIMSELRSGVPFKYFQQRTCALFEAQGHPTISSDPGTTSGYVHSVGHGLGLHVHERPFSGATAPDVDRLEPGVVATIEPGLYYPERGMGVRLEDTIWVKPDGEIEILVDYPLDLVLPIK